MLGADHARVLRTLARRGKFKVPEGGAVNSRVRSARDGARSQCMGRALQARRVRSAGGGGISGRFHLLPLSQAKAARAPQQRP